MGRCLNVLPEVIGHLVLSVLKTYAEEIEQAALVGLPTSAGSG
ncbi:hypothetical protein VB739_07385 [Cyanobium gracile UHCC 0281]|uniref:Uncharacterized protein n=1 Tax=Cyanobium gracile UHCC 0281 TaxID=3110309 RepID=A0ABU5SVK1_9CYAN|nr:hypothetical protein [Cyanobium gracile UHCC 0281]